MDEKFISDTNINIIYQTLIECDFCNMQSIFQENNKHKINELNNSFLQNIHHFYNTNKNNVFYKNNQVNINKLNKNFILYMIDKGNFHLNPFENQNNYVKCSEKKEQNIARFENEFQNKKREFDNEINIVLPPEPNFKDKYVNEKSINDDDYNQFIASRNNEIKLIYKETQKEEPEEKIILHISKEDCEPNIPDINNIIQIHNNTEYFNDNDNDNNYQYHKKVSWDDDETTSISKPTNILHKFKLKQEPSQEEKNEISEIKTEVNEVKIQIENMNTKLNQMMELIYDFKKEKSKE